MKKPMIVILVLVIVVVLVVAALVLTPAPLDRTTSAVCPVMGTPIPDVSKAAGKSVYKGKTYYFCCPGCKPKFDADPSKYAK